MNAVIALRRLGGIADAPTLIAAVSRREFDGALRRGDILRAGHNRYVLPGAKDRVNAAARVGGSLTLLSAAMHHGWRVKTPPARPQVVVPAGRKVSVERAEGVELFRGPVDGVATGKLRTVIDCLRRLPFDEALAVADSALADPDVTLELLQAAAEASSRTGRRRVLRVLRYADQRAANTFESALRALCIEAGLDVEPQVQIGDIGRCDVGDRSRRIAIEGDSFRYHSSPIDYERDVHRYTAFGRLGWLVLRFTLDDALERPDYVRAVLRDVLVHRPPVW